MESDRRRFEARSSFYFLCDLGHVYSFFHWCLTNAHKLNAFEQHTFVTSSFVWIRSPGRSMAGPSEQGLTGCSVGVGCTAFLSAAWDLLSILGGG